MLPTPVCLGFPDGSAGKESACNARDLDSIPELGRSSGKGKSYTLQYSGLENSMDCTVHGVAKSRTRLSDFHFQRSTSRGFWLFQVGTCSAGGVCVIGSREERIKTQWDFHAGSVVKNPPSKAGGGFDTWLRR